MKAEKFKVKRVYHKKKGGRIYDILINVTLEEAKELNPWLSEKDRIIIKTKEEEITINDNPNVKEYFLNGILKVDYLDENPNAIEMMQIIQEDIEENEL
ncbi:MAG: hypothetical protein U0W24_07200 [Bacteroidales bacterium]